MNTLRVSALTAFMIVIVFFIAFSIIYMLMRVNDIADNEDAIIGSAQISLVVVIAVLYIFIILVIG